MNPNITILPKEQFASPRQALNIFSITVTTSLLLCLVFSWTCFELRLIEIHRQHSIELIELKKFMSIYQIVADELHKIDLLKQKIDLSCGPEGQKANKAAYNVLVNGYNSLISNKEYTDRFCSPSDWVRDPLPKHIETLD